MLFIIFISIIIIIILAGSIKIVGEDEHGVIFRLGRIMEEPKGPGLVFILPAIDRLQKVKRMPNTLEVPAVDIVTLDNVTMKASVNVHYRVLDPIKAMGEVDDYEVALAEITRTTLRDLLKKYLSKDLNSVQNQLNTKIKNTLGDRSTPWGIEVSEVVLEFLSNKEP